MEIGDEVLYINACIFEIVSSDSNGNFTIESEFERYENVPESDLELI